MEFITGGQEWHFPRQFWGNLLKKFHFTVLNFIDSSSTPSHRRIHERAFVLVWGFFCERGAQRKLVQLVTLLKKQRTPKQCQERISILQGVLTLLELRSRQQRQNVSIPTTLHPSLSTADKKTTLENTYRVTVPNVLHGFL